MSAQNQRGYLARPIGGKMPPRGESQNALLADRQAQRGSSRGAAPRRYGPTASSSNVGPSAALLNSPSQSDKQALSHDTNAWGGFDHNSPEADDYLHNPDGKGDRASNRGSIFTARGVMNIGCLVVLILCILVLFAGYPIITFYTRTSLSTNGAYNLGGINSTGQIPLISNFPNPIDEDTPTNVRTRTGFDGEDYTLVFSDEFNKAGRTFWPGDDPFWTAVDLHYWPTGDFEWYHPSAATTKDGSLVLTMTQETINDLNFKSGMLQSWNQMCFQYSFYMEASVSLPGTPRIGGFWPGVWTMGNLGRSGYGATTEGTWPYSYGACDLGTLPNQTSADGSGPAAALTTGPDGGTLSYLPGQKLSACTCKGEDHPGPDVSVGRASPEIDMIEAQTDLSLPRGEVSQSFQIAPFDDYYYYANTSSDVTQYDKSISHWNNYKGGIYQQAISSLAYVDTSNYQLEDKTFGIYGMEMYTDPNDNGNGHITWVAGGEKSWTMQASAVGPNSRVGVSQRLIPEEPMAMVLNFGMSNNFQTVNFDDLTWPAEMHIDYIRVYQRKEGKMGCDPADRPTADYIARHRNAYDNANFTTWAEAGYTFPKNKLKDSC